MSAQLSVSPEPTDADGLDFHPGAPSSLIKQLLIVTKAIRGQYDRRLSDANASLPTWAILDALSGNEEVSQRRLGALCNIEGPTLTRYLDRLTIQGMVQRTRDRRDRRILRVSFTDAGRAYYDAVRAVAGEAEAAIEQLLSHEEQGALIALLHQMADRLADA